MKQIKIDKSGWSIDGHGVAVKCPGVDENGCGAPLVVPSKSVTPNGLLHLHCIGCGLSGQASLDSWKPAGA